MTNFKKINTKIACPRLTRVIMSELPFCLWLQLVFNALKIVVGHRAY